MTYCFITSLWKTSIVASSFSSVQEPSPPMDAYYLPGAAANGLPENSNPCQDTQNSRKRKVSGDTSAVKKSRVR